MRKPIAVPARKLSVYLQPFHHSSFLECALQPKIAKINKNPLLLHMPICNCFQEYWPTTVK